ncbi:MAG: ATP-binding protein [Chlamydiae bacterium]|nr:ATP-binding protein [Chlamydiota bacterium]MBI3267268.1 ATP-binding protein [Chlamydiota bacterium]
MYKRILTLDKFSHESSFLWGPRQTGKSTLLEQLFPDAPYYDLLLSDVVTRFQVKPSLLREELLSSPPHGPVILDEIQKVPELLDEIQWLMTKKNIHFILCGSSARKLKRTGANLLGGRAIRYQLYPLVFPEISDFDLIKALNHGLLPRHYLSKEPQELVESYIADYLQHEIAAESLVRNLPSFHRFLEVAAFSNGEIPVFSNIASDCGVSSPTVREYFEILQDTLIGSFCPAYLKRLKRRLIQSPKFYYFDVGIANFLLKRGFIQYGSESFGRAFEHFIYQEVIAHSQYSRKKYPVSYWRTSSEYEVDFILGDAMIALEVKGVPLVNSKHLKGLQMFCEDYAVKKAIVVSLDPRPRKMGDIEILPWKKFLEALWSGELI